MTEQQLQEMEAWFAEAACFADCDEHDEAALASLIAEVRRLQQHKITYENMDMATRAALGLPDGSGLGTVETINFLRFERDDALARIETLRASGEQAHNDRVKAWAERDAACADVEMLHKAVVAALAERDHYKGIVEQEGGQEVLWLITREATLAALTEARRVLREVLPVDCEHVHHPKRDQHPFDAACPVLQRAAAVLAQDTDA